MTPQVVLGDVDIKNVTRARVEARRGRGSTGYDAVVAQWRAETGCAEVGGGTMSWVDTLVAIPELSVALSVLLVYGLYPGSIGMLPMQKHMREWQGGH